MKIPPRNTPKGPQAKPNQKETTRKREKTAQVQRAIKGKKGTKGS